ncbi:MAG: hypothetical protein D6762_05280 [Candidatus Neomarinimicrobiota bacterium]|nr:MAG: hypothetical protein D6762_05280 [Candidatus Neomarinimicrobiota bacterium]
MGTPFRVPFRQGLKLVQEIETRQSSGDDNHRQGNQCAVIESFYMPIHRQKYSRFLLATKPGGGIIDPNLRMKDWAGWQYIDYDFQGDGHWQLESHSGNVWL